MATLAITASDGTTLLLDQDAALPEQGVDAGVSMRTVQTWYPGSSTPSVQIMGTKEEPITLRGTWRDDLLRETGGAQARANIARQLVLRQLPCTLTWFTDLGDAPLTRSGLVASFVPSWRRADLCGWTLTFQVDTATESEVIAVPALPLPNPYALADALRLVADAAQQVAEAAVLANNIIRAVA